MRPYRATVEAVTPPFLIFGMQRRMIKMGHPQTPGIMRVFATAARDALLAAPVLEQPMANQETSALCNDMTRHLDPRDPRDLLLACLAFTPLLAENGIHGALTDERPMLCLQEINDFAMLRQWPIHDKWITGTATQMLMRARLCGYYLRD